TLIIEELGTKGEPILPEGISARFRNICGAIVRNKLQNMITTSNWKKVPQTKKDVLWATVKERFTFPEGQEKFARHFAKGLLGRCFRNWRSNLNKEYVQKGKNARDEFENTMKDMKSAEKPHHLGAGGYAAKIAKWRREEEEWRRASLLDMFAGLDERSGNWIQEPSTELIYKRLAQLAEAEKKGLFRPDREKDQLTAMIRTAKHSGRVLGMSSTLPWDKPFPNDQASYRKCDRYKKNLEDKKREIAKQEFLEFLANQHIATLADPIVSDGQQPAEPTMLLAQTRFITPSSAGSIAKVRYPVDDIQAPIEYEHDKPFLYRWDLLEGPWELNKLHGWIMNAMKQGIPVITTHVPTKVFLGVLPFQIVIDFEDLHRLYCQQCLDVNLISVWCLDHWICIMILPKLGEAVVLDSASYDRHRYKNFIGIIQNCITNSCLYILKARTSLTYLKMDPTIQKRTKAMRIIYNKYCHKQPSSPVPCGYYVCKFIKNNGSNYNKIKDKQIDNICTDTARFILREIYHEDGAFFNKHGVLMTDEYIFRFVVWLEIHISICRLKTSGN
uniref:Ubiquitin-like protease family profile domain-containing protein n=1 Tax=Setaria italica TaxID=4555 RepID=K3YZ31_SETIT